MNRIATLISGIVFLGIAAVALYRLLIGFPLSIGGAEIGQTSTFLVFVACAALSMILLRGAAVRS